MSSTPLRLSSTNNSWSVFQILCVRAVAGVKRSVSVVRLVVLLNEVANVDLLLPEAGPESLPGRGRPLFLSRLWCRCGHRPLLHVLAATLLPDVSPSSKPVWRAIINSSL